jgi:AcrR family transcriptional regulator
MLNLLTLEYTPRRNGLSRTNLRNATNRAGMISEGSRELEAAAAEPSLRERNKAERRRRVLEAARAVFLEHGYENATTREIATRAGVAVGTVFVYARDKRDLLMTVVNDDLEAVTKASFANLDSDQPFLEQLIALFEPRYHYWVRDPELSTFALHESASARVRDVPSETERFYRRRHQMLDKIAELVAVEQRAGRLGTPEDPQTIAFFLMGTYLAHARFWLSGSDPQVPDGIARLRRQLQLAMNGLKP